MQEIVQGKILEIHDDGGVVIGAVLPSLERAVVRKYTTVEIGFCDGRVISSDQRKKIYALLNEISMWVGDSPEEVKEMMKWDFVINRLENMSQKMFSLATIDMNTASEFISYLVEFILKHDIPCYGHKLADLCDDIKSYVYMCLLNKKCAVCGKHADLHHVDAVGMGNDRNEIHHLGKRVLPLCREHHVECHTTGISDFMNKYHLEFVNADEKICKKYRLKV